MVILGDIQYVFDKVFVALQSIDVHMRLMVSAL